MKYTEEVVETRADTVEVEAESQDAAEDLALWEWNGDDSTVVDRWAYAQEEAEDCTSDDPNNHQGDTCPVHEGEQK